MEENRTKKTLYIKEAISRCEDVEELKEMIFPMINTQQDEWIRKINEIISATGYTKTKFAELCGVSRVTVDKWGKLKMLMQLSETDEIKRKVERAYDAVQASPLHSNTQVMNYEVEIMRLVDELENLLDQKNNDGLDANIDAIIRNIRKRNSMLQNV